jgi:hypothetical protein
MLHLMYWGYEKRCDPSVIIVTEIVLGYLIRRRLPDPLMTHEVIEEILQVLDAGRCT